MNGKLLVIFSVFSDSTSSHRTLRNRVFQYSGHRTFRASLVRSTRKPDGDFYRGLVYILTDAECASACEDFVAPFKNNHRAVIIGEQTGGTTGQPFFRDFGNRMHVRISTKREFFPDGSEFEGVGIRPDVEVHTTPDLLRVGKDPALEKVFALIQEAHK